VRLPSMLRLSNRIFPPSWGRRLLRLGNRAGVDPLRIVGIAVAIVAWTLVSGIVPFTVPSPQTTLQYLANNFFASDYLVSHQLSQGGGYVPHLAYTIRNVVSGVLAGSAIGVSLGLLSIPFPSISEVVNPIAGTFGAAPIVVAAPFFLIWFGILPTAQFLMVAFYTLLLMYIFSRRAGNNIRPEYVESALTLGARPTDIFRRIYVPGVVPELTAGIRIALAGSWGLEAVAELLGAQTGVGLLMKFYSQAFVLTGMFALTILLGLVAVAFDRIVVLVSRLITRWSEAGRALQL
jgi:ABC-type nitrate/sulfonate/bicarbonate transport system permease component